MPEVEADVLPVAVAADVAVEVAAVGVDAEELALGAQVGCGRPSTGSGWWWGVAFRITAEGASFFSFFSFFSPVALSLSER